MKVRYRDYTLVCDFSRNDILIPTYVVELDYNFDDISKAKRFIDKIYGE